MTERRTMNRERSDLATLEAALEEQLGGHRPPDLAARTAARLRGAADPSPASGIAEAPRGSRWLLAAAVMLVAIGLTYWIHDATRPGPDPVEIPAQDPKDAVRPKTMAQAKKWLRDAKTIAIRAAYLHDEGRSALLPHRPRALFDSSATAGAYVPLSDEKAVIAQLLRVLNRGPIAEAGELRTKEPWSHEVEVHVAKGPALKGAVPKSGRMILRLYRFGLGARRESAGMVVVHGERDFIVAMDAECQQFFEELVSPHLQVLVAREGLALTAAGLARLPAESKRVVGLGLSSTDLAGIGRFTSLNHLDLHRSPNAVDDTSVRVIARSSGLRALVLHARGIGPAHLDVLSGLANLNELFLIGHEVDWLGLRTAPVEAKIDGECAKVISRMQGLTELWVVGSSFTDDDVARLAALPRLRTLSLAHGTVITGTCFAAFRKHEALRLLHLDGCTNLSDAGVAEFQKIPTLRHVSLRSVPGMADEDLKKLYEATQLKRVILSRTPGITPEGLDALRRALPSCKVVVDETDSGR